MTVEHAMFKFEDLKVNSRDDRQTDRLTEWQPKYLALAHAYTCGETNDYPDDISELPYGYETYIRCCPKFKSDE